MARLGLFDGKKQRWVQFDEDTEILVSFLSKDELGALVKKAAKRAKMTGADLSVVTNKLVGEAACLGWRKLTQHDQPGLCDGHGRPIPFSPENRALLMLRSLTFSNFVNENAIDEKGFTEDDATTDEELDAVKNS